MCLLKNTTQPEKRDIFMKNGNESWDVLGDSRKRYRGPWAEIGKYWPGKEPIRLQDLLPCPLKKNKNVYWKGKRRKRKGMKRQIKSTQPGLEPTTFRLERNDVKFSWCTLNTCTYSINFLPCPQLVNSPLKVVYLVAKPFNRSGAKGDLVMIQTLLLFKFKLLCCYTN